MLDQHVPELADVDGFALVFMFSEEIQSFIDEISIQKIAEYLNRPKVEELFK